MKKWITILLVVLFCACERGGNTGSTSDETGTLLDSGTPSTDNTANPDTPWQPDNEQPDRYVSDTTEQPDDGVVDDPLHLYKSGSRIRARFGETPDGAKQFMGWYDNQTRTECAFLQTSEGIHRCLPTPLLYSSYFADSSCTTPLFMATSGCNTTPSWGVVYDECSRPIRVFQRGSVYSGSTGYVKSSSACTEVNLSYVTGYTFYTAGQEVPLSAFQMMSVSVE